MKIKENLKQNLDWYKNQSLETQLRKCSQLLKSRAAKQLQRQATKSL